MRCGRVRISATIGEGFPSRELASGFPEITIHVLQKTATLETRQTAAKGTAYRERWNGDPSRTLPKETASGSGSTTETMNTLRISQRHSFTPVISADCRVSVRSVEYAPKTHGDED